MVTVTVLVNAWMLTQDSQDDHDLDVLGVV